MVSSCGYQPLLETFACGVEMSGDCALGASQYLRGFRVAQVFPVHEKNRIPLLRRQGSDFPPKVSADQLILGCRAARLAWSIDRLRFDRPALWSAQDEDLATSVPQRAPPRAKVVHGNRIRHAMELG